MIEQPNPPSADKPALTFRSIWLSDFHLGIPHSKAAHLLDFLSHTRSDFLYLIGDIVDGWQLSKNWHWPEAHNDVIKSLLKRAREGTETFYIPGNHDEMARDFCGQTLGRVKILNEALHTTALGQKLLALHGDQFDAVVGKAKWLAKIGDAAYMLALAINYILNKVRQNIGMPYWSLSAYLKQKVKGAVAQISSFDTLIIEKAKSQNAEIVVCGHIHKAEERQIGPIRYYNDGDWVESCTALVEDFSGRLHIIDWLRDKDTLLAPVLAGKNAP